MTAAVKATLLADPPVSGLRIDVDTSNRDGRYHFGSNDGRNSVRGDRTRRCLRYRAARETALNQISPSRIEWATDAFHIAADLVVVAHFGYVLFVLFGALLVFRWRRIAWLHVPAAAWGIAIEWSGWICPLTPLENYLRDRSGQPVFGGDFIEHHVFSLLYPEVLTRGTQIMLGCLVITVNAYAYWRIARRARRGSSRG